MTVLIGILVFFFLIESPDKPCKWLTEEEREDCRLRIMLQDGGRASSAAGRKFSWKLLLDTLTDWQIWLMMIVFWSNTIPVYGLIFTMPQIIKNMGFTSSNAQLMLVNSPIPVTFAQIAGLLVNLNLGLVPLIFVAV